MLSINITSNATNSSSTNTNTSAEPSIIQKHEY